MNFEHEGNSKKPKSQREELLLGRYVKGKKLGQGAFALCFEGFDTESGCLVAIKVYDKLEMKRASFFDKINSEISILASLNHPSVPKFLANGENPRQILLVMEHGGSLSLTDLMKKPKETRNEEKAKEVFRSLFGVVEFLHCQNKVVHGDLKPDNVLWDEKEKKVKLIDFGFSSFEGGKDKKREEKKKICHGTASFVAPEHFSGRDPVDRFKEDIWALGVILFKWAYGEYPFTGPAPKAIFLDFLGNKTTVKVSEELRSLIQMMLEPNPLKRPSIKEVRRSYLLWLET